MSTLRQDALRYNSQFSFNIVPVKGKRPIMSWENWQLINQDQKAIEYFNWDSTVTGFAGVCGINDLRCIDFDKVNDPSIVSAFSKRLGLPENYLWQIKSGSGKGFHIWVRVRQCEILMKQLNGPKSVYYMKPKDIALCYQIELRWENCLTVLPASLHESGNSYSFLYGEPIDSAMEIDPELLADCLTYFCDLQKEKQILSLGKKSYEHNGYDKEKLESAVTFLGENLPDHCYDEWLRIGFGLATLGEIGRKYFIELSLLNNNYHDTEFEVNKKFDSLISDHDGKITIGTVYHIAEKYGWKSPAVTFWYVQNEKVQISRVAFKKFLEENGFFKHFLSQGYILIKSDSKILREVEPVRIKDFVYSYIQTLDESYFKDTSRPQVLDAIIKYSQQFFTPTFLDFLEAKEIQLFRDSKNIAYFYFTNGFVEVTADSITLKSYSEMEGCIWDKQIINSKFLTNSSSTDFETFVRNVCKGDIQRIAALQSAMGYLLHKYKDPSKSLAIIFLDEKISDGSAGRSGKGVITKAIGFCRKLVILDGKIFNFKSNFKFQSVNLDTEVVAFDDVAKDFGFQKLFSIITGGLTVEKKNKQEILIPFSESPKILLSTNFAIDGSDDSSLARQFTIEFSDYYNRNHCPVNDFGKNFFDDWNQEEWNDFFHYMLRNVQLFLKNGLIKYSHVNLKKKKIINSTCEEFEEFFSNLKPNFEYETKALLDDFKVDSTQFLDLSQTKFTHWIKEACLINEWNYNARKSNKNRYFTMINNDVEKITPVVVEEDDDLNPF